MKILVSILVLLSLIPSRRIEQIQHSTPTAPTSLPVLSFQANSSGEPRIGPSVVAEGWYTALLENSSGKYMGIQFLLLPPGKTGTDYLREVATANPPYPDWYNSVEFASGPIEASGSGTAETLIHLSPGTWNVVWSRPGDEFWAGLSVSPGKEGRTPDFDLALIARFNGNRVQVPANVTRGRHLWRFDIEDKVPHTPCVFVVAPGVTQDQLHQFLVSGTPIAGLTAPPIEPGPAASRVSAGQEAAAWFDLAPGHYAFGDCEQARFFLAGAFSLFSVN